jgi:glycosyltransferase involved in cell wall biosynthesis
VKFAVVMPVFNQADFTERSVHSLFAATSTPEMDLVLIDDASTDTTQQRLKNSLLPAYGKRLHCHRNPVNRGVNPSWNAGLDIARAEPLRAEYVAFVNNDVEFTPGWDVPLLAALQDDPKLALASPMFTDGQFLPKDWPRGAARKRNHLPILGAAFICRAGLFDEIGRFPEALKIYFGDNWITLAAEKRGYACRHVETSYVHHFVSVTTKALKNHSMIWAHETAVWKQIAQGLGQVN